MGLDLLNILGLTQEELTQRAIDQLIESFNKDGVMTGLENHVKNVIKPEMQQQAQTLVGDYLRENIEQTALMEFTPVDQWGQATGKKTTIRDMLYAQSKEYWDAKVDSGGKPTTYGNQTRAQYLMRSVMLEVFTQAMKDSMVEVVSGFKEALRGDVWAKVSKELDNMIKLPPLPRRN
jgi:hypothetical protein